MPFSFRYFLIAKKRHVVQKKMGAATEDQMILFKMTGQEKWRHNNMGRGYPP
jgi:hypothetical protein